MDNTPVKTDIVLVGGGHAHVEVLRQFGMRPEPGVRLTLISRETLTPYSGMLPGLVAGHYSHDDAHIDLAPLAQFAHARLYHDEVTGVDLVTRQVLCRQRPPVSFDLLSIDTGSAPTTAIAGTAQRVVPVKPVSNFHTRWQTLCERVLASMEPLTIGVVGGGAGGVELLMAARHRLLNDLAAVKGQAESEGARLRFHLVTSSETILPDHNPRVRTHYHRALERAGVAVTTAFEVSEVSATSVHDQAGRSIALDEILWVTTAAAPAWPRASGLASDANGFIRVNACLQSITYPEVFAAGDIAAVDPHPRPKSGVFAVRQGPPLAANLRRASRGEALKPYSPQRQFLSLISTGDRYAVASRGAFALAGAWVWRWKDFIDRRFMRRYAELPQMETTAPAGAEDDEIVDTMRCGGCGSKIGAEVLHEALTALAPAAREDVIIGLQQADDAAVVRVPPGHLAVHTVDAFRSFIDDPWMLGRVGAIHGLSDIYAMGATPQSALALVTLPYGSASRMRDDLVQVMRGAVEVFNAEDTMLVGGHTGEGPELALGFAINGYVAEDRLVRKRGVHDGDAIILTQALGSGVLFAAAMRGQARTQWIDGALAAMTTSKAAAAQCFIDHGVHAMTDVTGFGLVGHLHEMLDDDEHGAELSLAQLPLYAGAEALAERAVLSSLQTENRRAERHVTTTPVLASSARYQLAFDPQTAGGLLATVAADQAGPCIAELHRLGYGDSVIVGHVNGTIKGIHLLE